nr:hypothetical protein BaRGS_027768 [Batillaria attramentaria]
MIEEMMMMMMVMMMMMMMMMILYFSTGTLYTLLDWSKEYGRVYGIYLGRQPLLVTSDLDILKEVLVKDFGHFSDRFNAGIVLTARPIEKGVFFVGGADWKRIRNIITPTFSAGKLKMMEHFINRCGTDLAENLVEIAEHKGKVDVKEYFGAYTLDVITGTAFGLQVNSQKDFSEPFVSNIKKMMSRAGRTNVFFILAALAPFLAPLIGKIRNRFFQPETISFLLHNIGHMVEERRREKQDRRPVDFLQLLINAESSEVAASSGNVSKKRLTKDEIIAQVFIFFIAGYETTATTLQYLAYSLAVHPDVQKRVFEEIQQQLGDEKPSYENVGKLKYLEQTIYETLRLFPPVTMVTRMASETVTIKGVTIPKGFGVLVPICDVLRDPEYFPEPEKFMPERFSSANKNDVSFLAFGFGPRLCIGMRLALLEIKIAMVHVLRAVKFNKTPDLPEKMTFKPAGGLLPSAFPILIQSELRSSENAKPAPRRRAAGPGAATVDQL